MGMGKVGKWERGRWEWEMGSKGVRDGERRCRRSIGERKHSVPIPITIKAITIPIPMAVSSLTRLPPRPLPFRSHGPHTTPSVFVIVTVTITISTSPLISTLTRLPPRPLPFRRHRPSPTATRGPHAGAAVVAVGGAGAGVIGVQKHCGE